MITTYLLAANLLALTAFLLGVNNFSKRAESWRLLPLFLLVVSRALILILVLGGGTTAVAGLDVFSTFCVVWALVDTTALSPLWRRVSWLGGGAAFLLSLFPLIPEWPVPFEIHGLTIAIFSAPLILVSLGRLSWLHLLTPLVLAVGYFFMLIELDSVAWLVMLLAYVLLIGAIHSEGLQTYRGRQKYSEAVAQQAITLSRERQRMVEVSEIISAIPSIEEAMTHVARSMAHVTHSDQAAIFYLDMANADQFHLATVYSPERPVHLASRFERTFTLASFLPLQTTVEHQEQLLLQSGRDENSLELLYNLWYEERTGPTLIQPLSVQGQAVGALMLGNPVMRLPFQDNDRLLCRSLATQIGSMVDSYRHYLELELSNAATTSGYAAVGESRPVLAATGAAATGQPVLAVPVPLADVWADLPPLPAEDELVDKVSESVSDEQETILEAINEGVVVSDVTGRVQLVNKAAERILGRMRQDLMGQPIHVIYGDIDSSESIDELAAGFSRRNEPLPTFSQTKDRAIQGQLLPWRNEQKEWLGIIATFRDVTHKVRADEARNFFIMALSRELRAPLTTIKGYSELIIRGDIAEYTPDQLKVQNIIHSSADRMAAVLDNAVQIGAQNKKKILPQFENVNAADVVIEVVGEMTSLAAIRELELDTEIEPDLPQITADRQHFYRILANLLENACHFTPPGGNVTVRAWSHQERVGNQFVPQVVMAVADNGVGIPRTELKRIFEPFYQIKGVLSSGGMGMGLAVVKELVEIHKGRVWVESTEGKGSTFHVALPVSQQ